MSDLDTFRIIGELRTHAATQEGGIRPEYIAKLLRDAADDLDRMRFHLGMTLTFAVEMPEENRSAHIDNALAYYNQRNPTCQVTND